ncbi:MAG: SIR2 family protein [Anaerovoracaceae bacterium]
MKTAIFLGAGASKADGAPLQSEILFEYFNSEKFKNSKENMDLQIGEFFKSMFDIDVWNVKGNTYFPKFEEALGMLDLAKERGESFLNFGDVNNLIYNEKIDRLRIYFVFLLAITIGDKVKADNYHKKLLENLKANDILKDITFVSTNYDLLIDDAIREVVSEYKINYGIEQLAGEELSCDVKSKIDLLKIHGSLNWLYCPACNKLYRKEISITEINKELGGEYLRCDNCKCSRIPIMVPPSYYKDMTNIYLSTIWHLAEQKLLEVDHLIFCGYSFPNADMHIKYLLKRAQVNRKSSKLKITVINDFDNKEESKRLMEANRYKRFFGEDVNFEMISFEEFALDPMKIIKNT